MKKKPAREKALNIRVSGEFYEKLCEIALQDGRDPTAMARRILELGVIRAMALSVRSEHGRESAHEPNR